MLSIISLLEPIECKEYKDGDDDERGWIIFVPIWCVV